LTLEVVTVAIKAKPMTTFKRHSTLLFLIAYGAKIRLLRIHAVFDPLVIEQFGYQIRVIKEAIG
jgi:hypothetical protein